MKDSTYWKKRFALIEESQNRKGARCYAEIEKQYRQAQQQLDARIFAWYGRFAVNNGITMQEARRVLAGKELEEFKWDVQDYIRYGEANGISGAWAKQLENASARYHISRLEALKLHTQQSLEVLFGNQLDTLDSAMRGIYMDGYYHSAFEIQKGTGVAWNFASLDNRTISRVIGKPWAADGKNFSQRIWQNRKKLVSELHTELTQNILLGRDPQKAIDVISRKMNTSRKNAGRLVMTEAAFFNSAAQKDCFRELGVEQYAVIATLDSHTSDICQAMDGKVFPMAQYEPGSTAPPFHVWCRSTTVPYFGDEFDAVGERAARGRSGETYYVPAGMTYPEWKKAMVDGDKSGLKEILDGSIIKTEAEKKLESVIRELPAIKDIKTDNDRKAFAESLIDGLGIDRTNIPVMIENTGGVRGACTFFPQENGGICNYIRYSLEKGDDRRLEYQIKTAFHESYHLSCQGRKWDAVLDGRINPKWVSIEETFAETSAHYAARIYGVDGISPAYADILIQTLPRLKRFEKYSGCSTLADFGRIAWNDRLSGTDGMCAELYERVFGVALDESRYFTGYFGYMRDNASVLIDKVLENSPKYIEYREQMRGELESAMQKIESGSAVSELDQNERFIFPQVLINAMEEEGVR